MKRGARYQRLTDPTHVSGAQALAALRALADIGLSGSAAVQTLRDYIDEREERPAGGQQGAEVRILREALVALSEHVPEFNARAEGLQHSSQVIAAEALDRADDAKWRGSESL